MHRQLGIRKCSEILKKINLICLILFHIVLIFLLSLSILNLGLFIDFKEDEIYTTIIFLMQSESKEERWNKPLVSKWRWPTIKAFWSEGIISFKNLVIFGFCSNHQNRLWHHEYFYLINIFLIVNFIIFLSIIIQIHWSTLLNKTTYVNKIDEIIIHCWLYWKCYFFIFVIF